MSAVANLLDQPAGREYPVADHDRGHANRPPLGRSRVHSSHVRSTTDLGDEGVFVERDIDPQAAQPATKRNYEHSFAGLRVAGDALAVEIASVEPGGAV